ncbi:TPA: translation initiation factor IF-2 [Candidatus Falkowbacteria bacterium]|nr:translation initiation factor IF-2 [Candidatus Falkowbacteria bacterium]
MNITELARKLRTTTDELKEKLPAMGFDIGRKAIKVDDRLAGRIMRAWNEYLYRLEQEKAYRRTKDIEGKDKEQERGEVKIPPVLTVRDFATILDLPVTEVIRELMRSGVMATLNQRIDYDTAAIVASDLGYAPVEQKVDEVLELEKDKKVRDIMEKAENLVPRPPVIVVMGHVDHGKTKLLDVIRSTDVVAGEAGGITQHIGAYQIERNGQKITFIDTPGHEAFSAMRSRGAKVADIAILIVAANDGVKPQTIEAQKIAEAAGIPIVVAINKVDLPEANVEKTKQELAQHNLLCEDWGGKIVCVPISAKQKQNIDSLLDQVLLVAEMEAKKIVANPDGEIVGTVVESNVDKTVGPVATVLVKNGTLRKGDQVLVDGNYYGKIRTMKNYLGQEIQTAGPSTPARIVGLKAAPEVGDVVEVTEGKVKKIKSYKLDKKDKGQHSRVAEKIDDDDSDDKAKLNIILRSDVLGSQEAIIEALEKLNSNQVKIKFVSTGLGNVTESDVLSAHATEAMLIGFGVLVSPRAASLVQEKGVNVKTYKIIYELIDAVKARLNEIIKPEIIREDLGRVEVIKIFKKGDNSMVVGGRVVSGKVEKNTQAAVLRADEFVVKGKIIELKIGKQAVTDVMKGQECGLEFVGQPVIQEGDILDVYTEREVKRFV